MSRDTFLAVQGVSHGILLDVDLTASPGSLVALTGHSGSGKSTLCHLIAGLETPEQGRVTIEGEPTADITDWSVISVVPQRLSLLGQLTAVENLVLPSLASGHPVTSGAAYDMLERLGVEPLANRPAGQGSIGEQQRIAVARALLLGSALVVVDEPTAHQDDENAERVIAAVLAAVQAGALVVCSTHDPRLLARATTALALGSG
jgi:ABC-type lipoprotein export system ATPase subunit